MRQRRYPRKESKEALTTRLAPTVAAEANRKPAGGGDTDTSETINGERGRAPVWGATDSDIRTQSLGTKRRVGDLHTAIVAEKAVVNGASPTAEFWNKNKD